MTPAFRSRRIHPQDPDDPTCRHPSIYLADTSRFDATEVEYDLMLGCVMCSQWVAAPRTWQTCSDSWSVRTESFGTALNKLRNKP